MVSTFEFSHAPALGHDRAIFVAIALTAVSVKLIANS